MNYITADFKTCAKVAGFFASGSAEDGYRIAVRNKTQHKAVLAFLTNFFGDMECTVPSTFPALLLITKRR